MDSQKRYSRNRPSRGVGLRKTTGCLACRRRHIKCDEIHPHCGGCTRKKILCDYSHPSSTADAAWKLRRETTRVTRDRVNIGIDGRGDCGHGNGNGNTISDGRGKGNNDIAFDSNENGEIGNNGHGRSSNSDGDIEAIMDDVGNMVDGTGHICIDNQKDNNHSRHEAERTDDKLARHEDVSDESAKEERTAVGVMRISDKGERLDVHHTLETDVQLEDTLNMATGDDDVPQQQHEDEQMEFPTYNNELTHAASRQTRDDEPNFVDDNQACPKDQGPHNCTNAYNSVYENIPQDLVPPYRPSLPSGCSPDSHPMSGESHYSPTSRWLKLLISDTALDTALGEFTVIEQNGLDIFGNSLHQTPSSLVEGSSSSALPDHIIEAQETNQQFLSSSRKWLHPYLQERISPCCSPEKEKEEQRWKAKDPLVLRPQEQILFQHFIEHISQWMDLFDPQKPFGTFLPHLALHNVGLMNAILALSSRHLGIVNKEMATCADGFRPNPDDTISYYYRTLHYSQEAMQYKTYKTSLELLASSVIISSYEMLDGSSTDWEKHLKGVFWIQRSQIIHGDSSGLRQAVWWAWICQDTWAALRERRKPFTFWKPVRHLTELSPFELAARAIRYFAHVVAYCATTREDHTSNSTPASRSSEARCLLKQINDWKSQLTVEFNPLPLSTSPVGNQGMFVPIWIRPPALAVAMQVHYCSLILLHLHQPLLGGMNEYIRRQRQLKTWATTACGIAMTCNDYGSSIMTTQCVYIAGMVVQDEQQRSGVLDLLNKCSRRAGWPRFSLEAELRQMWQDESR